MVEIEYENGRVVITQCEVVVDFKLSDLNYKARQELINMASDVISK